jgi:protein-tyrosine phosphatase
MNANNNNTDDNNIINNNNINEQNTININKNIIDAYKSTIRPMSKITNNIYLGNIYDAQNIEKLLEMGIQKVLSLITETELLKYPPEIEHKLINIEDFPRQNIIQYFGECLLFMEDNKKVLVHCMAGASRSATIIIAYLMWKNQLDFMEAVTLLEQIRPIISPNYGFVRQLQMFEKLLKKNNYNINTINFKEIKYPRIIQECCF